MDGCWRPYEQKDYDLSAQMTAYWANFAKRGDPNGEGLPVWKAYDEEGLAMKLCVEGSHMIDYDKQTNGKLRELTDEILKRYE